MEDNFENNLKPMVLLKIHVAFGAYNDIIFYYSRTDFQQNQLFWNCSLSCYLWCTLVVLYVVL